MRYHHGNLHRALLDAAVAAIDAQGVDRLSIRSLARATDVSHTAFRHHFGDRRGLLTALAAEGYAGMTQALRAVERAGPDGFLETGVTYIEWALDHPAHFQVMFRPDLVDEEDPALQKALGGLAAELMSGVADFSGRPAEGAPRTNPLALAAWSLTHGFATLALAGNLPVARGASLGVSSSSTQTTSMPDGDDGAGQPVAELARSVLRNLSPPA
jgi:AcrR family transcriptional regulator